MGESGARERAGDLHPPPDGECGLRQLGPVYVSKRARRGGWRQEGEGEGVAQVDESTVVAQ